MCTKKAGLVASSAKILKSGIRIAAEEQEACRSKAKDAAVKLRLKRMEVEACTVPNHRQPRGDIEEVEGSRRGCSAGVIVWPFIIGSSSSVSMVEASDSDSGYGFGNESGYKVGVGKTFKDIGGDLDPTAVVTRISISPVE
ncbi:hypothetical protein RUND412_003531 [Rhizina undulata]